MKVELIDSAGGDISIVNSARVSFDKESKYVSTVGEPDRLSDKDKKLVQYLAKHQHMTPFRHNFIQLRCSVPLFLARQLMKHQAGLTWNEVSRRYVDDTPNFHVPKEWRGRPDKSIKQGSSDILITRITMKNHVGEEVDVDISEAYLELLDHSIAVYEGMIESKVAPELARMCLLQSMDVDFIWSGNLLSFSHIYNLRAGEDAQEEARVFAALLSDAIRPKFPVGWEALTV